MNIFIKYWLKWVIKREREQCKKKSLKLYVQYLMMCKMSEQKMCGKWAFVSIFIYYFHQPTTVVVESEQQATATHWFFLTHSDLPTLTHSEWDSSNCFIQNQASERERVWILPQFQPALYMSSLQKRRKTFENCPIFNSHSIAPSYIGRSVNSQSLPTLVCSYSRPPAYFFMLPYSYLPV